MKWQALNEHILDFMALLSDDALDFFEKSLDKYAIVYSPFSISINNHVHIQCLIDNGTAIILSFSYGRYRNKLNTGETKEDQAFITSLENDYYGSARLIELSAQNKRLYQHWH